MSEYTTEIKLVRNSRGVWDLDPFKGCEYGMKNCEGGCWGICYAAKIAKFRGYDFSKTVYRDFKDDKQLGEIGRKIMQTSFIEGVQPPFVRLGVMCDPSFDWDHTLKIVDKIRQYNPNIVIITKHWNKLNDKQLNQLNGLCINTSISALDTKEQREHRLNQYNLLKKYCNSVLRVNTADFNDVKLKKIQEELLENENIIDNILRIPLSHPLVKNGIVNVRKYNFLNGSVYASKYNKETYFGNCNDCPDKCGISFFNLQK